MTLPLLSRAVLAWGATGVGLARLAVWLRPELALLQHVEAATFVELLTALSASVVLGCGLWFWLTLTAAMAGVLHERRAPWLPSPRWMRRLALVLCGLTVLTAPATAHGVPVAGEPPGTPDSPSLEGLALPELPATLSPTVAPGATVVVTAGDTLWSIAAKHLPPDSAPHTIERRWRRIWRDNRSVIGDNPDLIHPGQRLVATEEEL